MYFCLLDIGFIKCKINVILQDPRTYLLFELKSFLVHKNKYYDR